MDELTDHTEDLANLIHILILELSDTLTSVDVQLGFSLIELPIDVIESHPGWHELTWVLATYRQQRALRGLAAAKRVFVAKAACGRTVSGHRYPLVADNMTMVFVELPIFIRCAVELFLDEDIAELQNTLLENPAAGDLIPGGRGLRKLRVPLPGRGKRGGARVIYYHWVSKAQCYLVFAYAKNVSANLTSDQLRRLAEMMQAEIRDE